VQERGKVVIPHPPPRPSTAQLHIAVSPPSWCTWQVEGRLLDKGAEGGTGGAGVGGGAQLIGRGLLDSAPAAGSGVLVLLALGAIKS
jgi:hypothetical protein